MHSWIGLKLSPRESLHEFGSVQALFSIFIHVLFGGAEEYSPYDTVERWIHT